MNATNAILTRLNAIAMRLRAMSDEQLFLLLAFPLAAIVAGLHYFCEPDRVLWFWSRFMFAATLVVNFGIILIVASLLVWNGGKGLTFTFGPEAPSLSAGDALKGLWGGFNIAPDILVITSSQDESGELVERRLSDAMQARKAGQWIVCITFRHPVAVIVTDDGQSVLFSRSTPPYQGPEWPPESRIRPEGYRYEHETWEQYQDYLRAFLTHYPEYAKIQKPVMSESPLRAFMSTLKTAALLCACALTVFTADAQTKTQQVARYLGSERTEMFRPEAGPVKFVFEKAVLVRTADGTKTLPELLRADQFFTDENNAGRLIGIRVSIGGNPATINPEPPVSATSATGTQLPGGGTHTPAGRGSAIVVPDTGAGFWGNIPDAQELEAMKASILREKKALGRELSPRHKFIDWVVFNFVLPVIILIGAVAFYIAKAAQGDSALSRSGFPIFGWNINAMRERATSVVAGCCWLIGSYYIISDLIATYFVAESLWWWLFRTVLIVFAAYKITRWIVPNPTIINYNGGGNDFLPLNSGRQ